MFCSNCGQELLIQSPYCKKCGNPIVHKQGVQLQTNKSSKKRLALFIILGTILVIAGITGYLFYTTFTTHGDAAIDKMNSTEMDWLEIINGITPSMNKSQVYAVLGDPDEELFNRAKWEHFAGSFLSELRVYFSNGHPERIAWYKLGYFTYEIDL